MTRGTCLPVNKALMRPLMIGGVEKRFVLLNALLSFPLVASTHFHFPACFIGVLFFIGMHCIFLRVSKSDPHVGKLFKRSTRYSKQGYFPAKSHPSLQEVGKVNTVKRPW